MAVSITVAADGQTLDVGEPSPLFLMHLAQRPGIHSTRSQSTVAPDGRFLMNVIVGEAASVRAITVVVNWQEELKQRGADAVIVKR